MPKTIKIALLGGDTRQISVAEELSEAGFLAEVWGIEPAFCRNSSVSLRDSWEKVVDGCDVLILPLPASTDGIRVNCPLLNKFSEVKLSKIFDLLSPHTLILGGRLSPRVKELITERGFRFLDYFSREELQIKNAVPTAEGAISLAMNEMSVTISDSRCAVVGFGRIGKILSGKLKALNANVTVAARKMSDLAMAQSMGCQVLPISIENEKNSLTELTAGYHVIFNTVPAWVIDKQVLDSMSPQTLIIDLASAPGGVDIAAAKERGVKVIWALSLPGKYAPTTAGKIIAQTICQMLREEGIEP